MKSSSASFNTKQSTLFGTDLVQTANSHIYYTSFRTFKEVVELNEAKCPKVKDNLKNLCMLYALNAL